MRYSESTSACRRRITREVAVGSVIVGGSHPIRIQSMTTTPTDDVALSVDQIIRLYDSGCEIMRLTVQGKKEAFACEEIKNQLLKRNLDIPLVADIHFYPPAAMIVADFVDKVRINPGNFVDKRATFKHIDYTDKSYREELDRIEEKFAPLVLKCKALKRAMRIGCNHGSLSDRIMNRYGDTPQGMVESALEYAHIARKYEFHELIFSMKASSPLVMIQAYRLLVAEMIKLNWDYPLHLGVTEAGEGEDGRVKSAIGIGSLLLDGLGDTIRVSLTEEPEHEIDPCRRLKDLAEKYQHMQGVPFIEKHRNPFVYEKRHSTIPKGSILHPQASVGLDLTEMRSMDDEQIANVDFVIDDTLRSALPTLCFLPSLNELNLKEQFSALDPLTEYVRVEDGRHWDLLLKLPLKGILLAPPVENRLFFARQFFDWLQLNHCQVPVLLHFHYEGEWEDIVMRASAECGSLLCDGLGDGIVLRGTGSLMQWRQLSFNILQASRLRTVKTEFISCPSCGRTLFNLQDVAARIRDRTSHLPGVKIAIMGCIVNGPGEMADADFGYVGSRPGKIDLYVGKTCVERNIDHAEADHKLIDLIRAHGKWIEPQQVAGSIVSHM
ncbi:MAG: (E)-4-hydroxy-3-methylbut-2-enyl-diphosphate synthase [Simkaniaceae bacterium]|nr:(E)-4-hydroxy-3-methylbut-2-enyl-diphosphate synthase [Simkaniaceae bacterium]MCF7851981.1 (E)-4-hydroxy-3-methylbut-2-enyl-diphosphate synthase [Simkaniaceae bacterium]